MRRERITALAEIVGQHSTRHLAAYAADRKRPSACFLLEGPPGCGKTASAHAMAAELGCDDYPARIVISASDLSIGVCRDLFEVKLWQTLLFGGSWKTLIIEELERLPSQSVGPYLKTQLDAEALPPRVTIVATSNDASGLEPALVERFWHYPFSNGPHFAEACRERLLADWQEATGDDMPPAGYTGWGVTSYGFSMRRAQQCFDDALRLSREAVCV